MSVSLPAVGDPVSAILASTLDGLAVRQRVIADNIANVDTPGYRASSVDFESSLRTAIESGDETGTIEASMQATDTPVGANGNNVDLRKETLAATQTQFQYQLMTRAVSDRFEITRLAAGQ